MYRVGFFLAGEVTGEYFAIRSFRQMHQLSHSFDDFRRDADD